MPKAMPAQRGSKGVRFLGDVPEALIPTLKERKGSEFYLHMDLVCKFLEIPFLVLDLF